MRHLLACVLAVITLVSVPTAAQAALNCGDVITQDTVLTESLSDCDTGLIVGADDVTIDLNGHSITGTGVEGSGIRSDGHSGMTIMNGSVRGFPTGVWLSAASTGKVTDLSIQATAMGIRVADALASDSPGLVITGNVVTNSGTGLLCTRDGGVAGAILVSENTFSSNLTGISLQQCRTDLVHNNASDNSGDGIFIFRSSRGLTEGNKANRNGRNGIWSTDSHRSFIRNVTNANGADGLIIRDSIADHGPFHSVQRHVANANNGYGIFTTLDGVVDGGKNRAHANAEAAQCLGVVCNQ